VDFGTARSADGQIDVLLPLHNFSKSFVAPMSSKPSTPCLSVIMPAYNEKDTIGAIVEAVLKQPLVAELICVDDRSEDGTAAILENYVDVDPRLRVLHHLVNRGKGAALRTGNRSLLSSARRNLLCEFVRRLPRRVSSCLQKS
jgi:cellulose synthase/poly-beta-1,6-N-acetylglucosamine synthase-like glycosyltransferase